VIDLFAVAKHGAGNNVYLVRFHYIGPTGPPPLRRSAPARPLTRGERAATPRRAAPMTRAAPQPAREGAHAVRRKPRRQGS
jgi:hypothetical protein